MQVELTPLMKKLLANPEAKLQLAKALTDRNQLVHLEGKTYTLKPIQQ
jgi:hypothetical protein